MDKTITISAAATPAIVPSSFLLIGASLDELVIRFT